MNQDQNAGKKLTQWLLAATILLLVVVLSLQIWQMFFRSAAHQPPAEDASAAMERGETTPLSGPSPGKEALIEAVQELNGDLSPEALAALSTDELEQLWETGAPGLPIGLSAAAEAAETYAGTLAVDSVTSSTDPELDESPAHYEVELHHVTLGDFEYKIDAYSGKVLEGEANILRAVYIPADDAGEEGAGAEAPQASGAPQVPETPQASGTPQVSDTPQASGTPQVPAAKAPAVPAVSAPAVPTANAPQEPQGSALIGEEAAKSAAYDHAGIQASKAENVAVKLDWDDGIQVYEVEFWSGSVKYEYEIDAATGAVSKAEQETRHGGSHSGDYIGDASAKRAALAHAGISEDAAGRIKCKLDTDDNQRLYEIEFRVGGTEYEYEIDAVTGEILKAEQDH